MFVFHGFVMVSAALSCRIMARIASGASEQLGCDNLLTSDSQSRREFFDALARHGFDLT
jgi:hypothetical protein